MLCCIGLRKWIRKKFGAEYEEMQDKDGRIP